MCKIKVRPSPIHGHGVFARETIRKGERIGKYYSRRTTQEGIYVLWLFDEDNADDIAGYEGIGRLRFLNHSSSPNSEFGGLDLYATRTIQANEEITFHYGDDWVEVP